MWAGFVVGSLERENQQQTQPTYGAGKLGFEPTPHWREASALTTVSK